MHSGMSAVQILHGQLKCEVPGAEEAAFDWQQGVELAVHLYSGEVFFFAVNQSVEMTELRAKLKLWESKGRK